MVEYQLRSGGTDRLPVLDPAWGETQPRRPRRVRVGRPSQDRSGGRSMAGGWAYALASGRVDIHERDATEARAFRKESEWMTGWRLSDDVGTEYQLLRAGSASSGGELWSELHCVPSACPVGRSRAQHPPARRRRVPGRAAHMMASTRHRAESRFVRAQASQLPGRPCGRAGDDAGIGVPERPTGDTERGTQNDGRAEMGWTSRSALRCFGSGQRALGARGWNRRAGSM